MRRASGVAPAPRPLAVTAHPPTTLLYLVVIVRVAWGRCPPARSGGPRSRVVEVSCSSSATKWPESVGRFSGINTVHIPFRFTPATARRVRGTVARATRAELCRLSTHFICSVRRTRAVRESCFLSFPAYPLGACNHCNRVLAVTCKTCTFTNVWNPRLTDLPIVLV